MVAREWERVTDGRSFSLRHACFSFFLFRAPGQTRLPPSELRRREHMFCTGQWVQLLRESADAVHIKGMGSGVAHPPLRRTPKLTDRQRRAERATALAHLGELSAAAKAPTAPPLAPATQATLYALRDPRRRPQVAQVPLDADVQRPSVQPARQPTSCPTGRRGRAFRVHQRASPCPAGR